MKSSRSSFALGAVLLTVVSVAPAALGQSLVLESLSPSSVAAGGPGFTLTVNGAGFIGSLFSSATVLWNGAALSTSYISGNQLSALVPAGLVAAQGSAAVTVVNPGGAASNSLTFTISPGTTPTPALYSLNPGSAAPGAAAFTLAVNGSGFVNGALVQWNGSALSTSFVNVNQLSAFVPASLVASPGSAAITVTDPGGTTSNSLTFPITSAATPSLFSLSPNATAAGGVGFSLTVNGSGFVTGAVVLWNGSVLSSSYVSANQLTAFVAASLIATSGSAGVAVVNPGGATSNSLTFIINSGSTPAPVLYSLNPGSAAPGGSGFTLAVNGTGFVNGAVVLWNGSALLTGYISATQVSAVVSAGLIASAGSASVTVVNPGGALSNSLTFQISSFTSPTLFSLSPNSTAAGGPGFSLTVSGSGFLNGAVVQWNGSALSTGFISGNLLGTFVPASLIASAGSASVTVLNPGLAVSNALTFNVIASATPSLFSLSPSSAASGGPGFSLAVYGAGFVNGAVVQWNGLALSTGFVSANQLNALVSASLIASSGSATIAVANPGGAPSNTVTFSIGSGAAPALTGLAPSSAAAGGPPFALTVNGSGFLNGAVVQWNNAALPTTFVPGGTQLIASVPASLIANQGTANITVAGPNGTVSNGITFSVFGFNSALRVAQIAEGSSWKTLIQVVNLDVVPVSYSFRFWDDNGNQLPLPIVNGTAGVLSGTLGVGATAFAETPGTSPALVQGWAEAASSGRIGVLTIFRQIIPGRPDSEGTVTGVPSGTRVFLPFDNSNGYVTGVAVANTNQAQAVFITLTFDLENGTQLAGSLSLPPHAHTAFDLTSMYPSLAGVRGSMELTASTPDIAVVGLRFSPTNSFTSLGQFQ